MSNSEPEKRRLILWANDSPLNARDMVIEQITSEINAALKNAEMDSCYLNDLIAYLRCQTGVIAEAGGGYDVEELLPDWRTRALEVFDAMSDEKFKSKDEREEDRAFVIGVFDDLTNQIGA